MSKPETANLHAVLVVEDAEEANGHSSAYDRQSLLAVHFHTLSIKDAVDRLESNVDSGLQEPDEINKRLQCFGPNSLETDAAVKWFKILFEQVFNAMNAVLTIGLILSGTSGEWMEFAVIMFVIVLNTAIGFKQEYRAERTMDSLRKMASPTARVLRNTTVAYISASQVVPGDVLMFEEGDIIPADGRIIECFHVEVDEAQLTGESLPVQKHIDAITNPDEPVGDRTNLVYSSTVVTKGRGKAVVIRTGMDTEIGQVAEALARAGKKKQKFLPSVSRTQLEQSIAYLALFLLILVGILAFIVFAVNGLKYSSPVASYALSVVIAVLPEGLTAVITIIMAWGVRRMALQKAIIRKRMALEALGSVTNVCSDKTGTLTQGKMSVTRLFIPSLGFYGVEASGYRPIGKIHFIGDGDKMNYDKNVQSVDPRNVHHDLLTFTQCAALCNMSVIKRKGVTVAGEAAKAIGPTSPSTQDLTISPSRSNTPWHELDDHELEQTDINDWEAIGDPTEAALQAFAWKLRMGKPHLASKSTRLAPYSFDILEEFSFDSVLKRMSVIVVEKQSPFILSEQHHNIVFCKGAFESVFDVCSRIVQADGVEVIGDKRPIWKSVFSDKIDALASRGLRIIALAYKKQDIFKESAVIDKATREQTENDLIFLGLAGIYDPPRLESKAAVNECRAAGISVHMLTGDHPKTAISIAKEIEIIPKKYHGSTSVIGKGYYCMVAPEFDNLSESDIDRLERLPTVIARCSPVTKVKMVDALLRRRKIVAMTGDGTNDAPSLKKAHVGIAMGMNGSDVAKQASDIVLTDDNFATIVKAIAEGRRIFSNIQKFISHLMSGNVSEIIALIIGLAFMDSSGKSVYLMSPVQILFLNMITSSPPAIGLGMEPPATENMKEPPKDNTKGAMTLFSKEVIADIIFYGCLMGGFALSVWTIVLYESSNMIATRGNPLGEGCNGGHTAGGAVPVGCEVVYRARTTSFVTLTNLLLIHAYNCRSLRQSIVLPSSEFAGWKKHTSNTFLFRSVIFGFVVTVITVYVPILNTDAFKQMPIDWEWYLIAGSMIVFLTLSELYKWMKRRYFPPIAGEFAESQAQTAPPSPAKSLQKNIPLKELNKGENMV